MPRRLAANAYYRPSQLSVSKELGSQRRLRNDRAKKSPAKAGLSFRVVRRSYEPDGFLTVIWMLQFPLLWQVDPGVFMMLR